MIAPETFDHIENIKKRTAHLWKFLDGEQKLREIEALEAQMGAPTFWDNNERAQKHIGKVNGLKRAVLPVVAFRKRIDDLDAMKELIDAGSPEEQAEFGAELNNQATAMVAELDQLEIGAFLTGQFDRNNAIFSIQAGAGGTESNDWAGMLLRMYSRWANAHGYSVELVEETAGEQAGIKSATLQVKGPNAYGWLKTEAGVHRLVRISPYDAAAKRHTSFASAWVYPVIDDAIEIEINPADVRTDTYRASGAGGQHINKTDSAVRLTHIPTGIAVACQAGRSQHANRDEAWKMLRARLYELELQKREAAQQALEDQKTDIGWGHQIRSYVLQPYQMVKDLRTGVETSDTQGVLDGDLDAFMGAALAQRVGATRDA